MEQKGKGRRGLSEGKKGGLDLSTEEVEGRGYKKNKWPWNTGKTRAWIWWHRGGRGGMGQG